MMSRDCSSPIKLFRCGICNVSFKLYKSLRDHKTRSKRHQKLRELLLERLRREKTDKAREKKRGSKGVHQSNEVASGKDITFQIEGDDDREIIRELPMNIKTELVAELSQERFGSQTLVEQDTTSTPIPQRYSLRSNRNRSYKVETDDEHDNDESYDSIDSDSSEETESSSSSDDETETHVAPTQSRQIRKTLDMRSADPKEIMPKQELSHQAILLPIVPMTEGPEDNEREDDSKETKYVVPEPSKSFILIPTRKKLPCPNAKCKLWFTTAQTLETHKKLHGNFKCNFCDEVQDYAPSLALHETRHASADEIKNLTNSKSGKDLHCSRCFRHFKRKERFIIHFLKVHLNLSAACRTCPICSAESVTKDRANRKQHFIRHHKTDGVDPSNILTCDQCPAYFLRSTQLLTHKYKIHFKEKCPLCDKRYNGKRNVVETLIKHMDQVHPEHNAFPHLIFRCKRERCRERKRFATEQDLKMHKERHHDLEEKIMKCQKCEKEFTGLKRLKCHVKDVHGPPIHVCPQCGRAFKSLLGLYNHKVYHKGPDAWKFQCSTCGRKFAARQKLDQHMRTHTKEKPFVCQFCGTQYAHRHNWRNHVKSRHPDENAETDGITPTSSSALGKGMTRKGSRKGDCILAGVRQT